MKSGAGFPQGNVAKGSSGCIKCQGLQTRKPDSTVLCHAFWEFLFSAQEPLIWGSPESAHKCLLILSLRPLYLVRVIAKFLRKDIHSLDIPLSLLFLPRQRTKSDRLLPFSDSSSTSYYCDFPSSRLDSTGVLGFANDVCDVCPLGAQTPLTPYWIQQSPCLSLATKPWWVKGRAETRLQSSTTCRWLILIMDTRNIY